MRRHEQYVVKIERDSRTGVVVEELWSLADGRLHRIGGPAYIERDPATGDVLEEMWMRRGVRHRDDGPAHSSWLDGASTMQWYFIEDYQVEPFEGTYHGPMRSARRRAARPNRLLDP